ncbi:MAG: helix-turn-helix transcriptional regulator, partial [Raoultibacter sp.]
MVHESTNRSDAFEASNEKIEASTQPCGHGGSRKSECADRGARKPCCRKRGGGGGALVEPAALAALLYAGGYGYDLRRIILEMSDGEVDVDVGGLYRILRRMEESGSVISRWHDGE